MWKVSFLSRLQIEIKLDNVHLFTSTQNNMGLLNLMKKLKYQENTKQLLTPLDTINCHYKSDLRTSIFLSEYTCNQ